MSRSATAPTAPTTGSTSTSIFMPPRAAFDDVASFYGTLLHEAAHATGAKHRLDRDFGQRFHGDARAIEEVTAELTAGFVLADLGIAHRPRPDHAAYVASWLKRAEERNPRDLRREREGAGGRRLDARETADRRDQRRRVTLAAPADASRVRRASAASLAARRSSAVRARWRRPRFSVASARFSSA